MHFKKNKKDTYRNKGYFKVKLEEGEITCAPKVSQNEISKEQEELYLSVEDTMSIINSSTLINDTSKKYYIEKLHDIALTGLSIDATEVYPGLAFKALVKLKEEILLRESSNIKNRYMGKLGKNVIVQTLVLLLLIFGINNLEHIDKGIAINLSSYMYVYIGTIVGAWISFGARKPNLTFEELSTIESDGLSPGIRLIYIGLCSIIIFLFLRTEIIVIAINNISTRDINNSIEMQLALGALIGLVEYKISGTLFKKANFVIDRCD
ncbi:hypothetical protein [Paraclostridium dentum]|uniref:hypothetical protein n=1 Tax=Paraclostridium dentum TaxID=2662455 RepID=UPI0034641F8C